MDPIFLFFLVMLVFLYLLLVRPQRQQAKRHQEMLQNLAVGDEVITMGGIYGEVTDFDDERVQLEIDADVRIAVSRRAIASKVTAEESVAMAGEPEAVPRDYAEKLAVDSARHELKPWETARVEIEGQIARLEDDPLVGKRRSELKFLKTQLQRIDEKVRREAA